MGGPSPSPSVSRSPSVRGGPSPSVSRPSTPAASRPSASTRPARTWAPRPAPAHAPAPAAWPASYRRGTGARPSSRDLQNLLDMPKPSTSSAGGRRYAARRLESHSGSRGRSCRSACRRVPAKPRWRGPSRAASSSRRKSGGAGREPRRHRRESHRSCRNPDRSRRKPHGPGKRPPGEPAGADQEPPGVSRDNRVERHSEILDQVTMTIRAQLLVRKSSLGRMGHHPSVPLGQLGSDDWLGQLRLERTHRLFLRRQRVLPGRLGLLRGPSRRHGRGVRRTGGADRYERT